MIFVQTELKGLWLIDLEKKSDDRGFFARSWCVEEFGRHGLKPIIFVEVLIEDEAAVVRAGLLDLPRVAAGEK